jgi:MFS family permease
VIRESAGHLFAPVADNVDRLREGSKGEVSVPVPQDDEEKNLVGGPYAKYVLGVLVVVYIFNFIDRQILSILAEDIKADLGLADAQIGFLYGTAFAVFYAVFGIPLGRLADVWSRKSLISIGLAFWSLMTALSGTARSFVSLAVYRFGVGIGEASASPSAFSMLSDYFPARVRATVLAVYSSGVYIGAGVGLFLGGTVVELWGAAYPDSTTAPFGLKPWQAAYMAVGLPGLLVAVWVATLREPRRGLSDGITTAPHPHPFREAARELMSVLPPFAIFTLARVGGSSPVLVNLVALLGIGLLAYTLILWLGAPSQWIALGIGVYAAVSWVQNLKLKDPVTFTMIFRCPTMGCVMIAFPCIAFVTYGLGFWGVPFLMRVHGVDAGEVGRTVGVLAAIGGFIGVVGGSVLSDFLRRKHANAGLYVALAVPLLTVPVNVGFLMTDNITVAYALSLLANITSTLWIGIAAGTVNDLVLPRMRALTSAFYLLMITFIGLALGPYTIGQVSDHLAGAGYSNGDALRYSQMIGLSSLGISAVFILIATRFLPRDRASVLERARRAGEVI